MNEINLDVINTLSKEYLQWRLEYFVAYLVGFDELKYRCINRPIDRLFLDELMACLAIEERTFMALRFGFVNGQLTELTECVKILGVTRLELKQMFASSVDKLQSYLVMIIK